MQAIVLQDIADNRPLLNVVLRNINKLSDLQGFMSTLANRRIYGCHNASYGQSCVFRQLALLVHSCLARAYQTQAACCVAG